MPNARSPSPSCSISEVFARGLSDGVTGGSSGGVTGGVGGSSGGVTGGAGGFVKLTL